MREQYKLCMQCGNFCHLTEGQAFCMLCGTKLIEKCPGCHEPIFYPTAKFCPACGKVLVILADKDSPDIISIPQRESGQAQAP